MHFDLYSLFLCMFSCLWLASCICLFCQNFWYTCIPLIHLLFIQNLFIDSIVFEYVCIPLALTKHTYALKFGLFWWKLNFYDFHNFHVCKGISYWALMPHSMILLITWFSHSHYMMFSSWLCFHEYYMCYIDFEWHWFSEFHVLWNIFLFYSLLEGFRTSL